MEPRPGVGGMLVQVWVTRLVESWGRMEGMGVQSRGGWVALGERLRRRGGWRVIVVAGSVVSVAVTVAEEVSVGVLVDWVDDSVDVWAAELVVAEEVLVVVLEVLVGEAV